MQFTKDQQRVIDARKKNILVSAAAGSGKTAVLVERIIRMVVDENAPVELFVGQEDGRLLITQKNRKKKEISHVESHQIGILSIKSIAGNYGGDVKVINEETAFEIAVRLIEVS